MKFILAKKVNMTQIFGEDGKVQPATILSAQPVTISQIKTKEKDGYTAVQIGAGTRREKNMSKPVKGHLKELGNLAVLKEFRVTDSSVFNKGDKISLESFAVGDSINVSAISKGKGFQGVVKRHGFHGGPRSHGQKHSEREPGSIGGGGRAGGKVIKGMRMAGRTGSDRITVKNLKVIGIDQENNIMLVSGAVPGRRGTLVEIRGN
ncbi:MAG: 50S ribosomal protein L3 [Candidatus Zambryskibacteria bacterium RIFOXYC1_FULL_39_10]|uniref:Large ribosomal subunit protein uL3 n=1 Tax=Candidatus Zambryskibacteria bacterium RIFOXYC1_FULL_39_10 TaxID=1802779 RepID=A0A1G2V464_9BACT|nr:MAG: 50S ribosomal protein L3 [Candidatus Zambryskibacteria bacterium RIFOXYD1_FULL_39_35]OHB16421.1 MAG: 50S ribosomal protein L3 [Candidatus Zambryskibacteria bacterium RIFOXYC1_FULL_39_10]